MSFVPIPAAALSISYLVSSFLDNKKRVENADRSKRREKQLRMKPTAELDRDECKSCFHCVLNY